MKYIILSIIILCISCTEETEIDEIKPKYPKEGLWYSAKKGGSGINGLNYHFYVKENNFLTVEIDNGITKNFYYGKWKFEKDTVRMGWNFDEKQSIDSAFFNYDITKAQNSQNPSPANGYIIANDPFNINIPKAKSVTRTFVRYYQ